MPKLVGQPLSAVLHSFLARLPVGAVWPRHPDSWLVRTCAGLMGVVERFLARVALFLNVEAYPPTADAMLPDWERVLGLPEQCLPLTGQTLAERQLAVEEKLQRRPGGQDRPYFIELARRLGYEITITEFRPFMFGVSEFGSATWGFAPPQMRFVWVVGVPGARLSWFRFGGGGGRLGQDPHLTMRRAEDLECLLRKLGPEHTRLVFSYQGV